MLSYTGIPVIAWNADNSGLLVNRVRLLASGIRFQDFQYCTGFCKIQTPPNGATDRASSPGNGQVAGKIQLVKICCGDHYYGWTSVFHTAATKGSE